MVVKVWRSVDMLNNVEVTPLAVCDMRTVAPEDMIDNDGKLEMMNFAFKMMSFASKIMHFAFKTMNFV